MTCAIRKGEGRKAGRICRCRVVKIRRLRGRRGASGTRRGRDVVGLSAQNQFLGSRPRLLEGKRTGRVSFVYDRCAHCMGERG